MPDGWGDPLLDQMLERVMSAPLDRTVGEVRRLLIEQKPSSADLETRINDVHNKIDLCYELLESVNDICVGLREDAQSQRAQLRRLRMDGLWTSAGLLLLASAAVLSILL